MCFKAIRKLLNPKNRLNSSAGHWHGISGSLRESFQEERTGFWSKEKKLKQDFNFDFQNFFQVLNVQWANPIQRHRNEKKYPCYEEEICSVLSVITLATKILFNKLIYKKSFASQFHLCFQSFLCWSSTLLGLLKSWRWMKKKLNWRFIFVNLFNSYLNFVKIFTIMLNLWWVPLAPWNAPRKKRFSKNHIAALIK